MSLDSVPSIIDALERAPAIVVPLVREVPPALLKRRPASGKWSAHEHACHLAVVHALFFERLDHLLANPSPVITPYDPGTQGPDIPPPEPARLLPGVQNRGASAQPRMDGGVASAIIRP